MSGTSWDDESSKKLEELYVSGMSRADIAEAIGRSLSSVQNRISVMCLPEKHGKSRAKRKDKPVKAAKAEKSEESVVSKVAGGTHNFKMKRWTEAEDAFLFEQRSKRKPMLEVLAQLNKRFKNDRTISGAKQRLNILKNRAKGFPGASKKDKKSTALARVKAPAEEVVHLEPLYPADPVAEERQIRVDFPQGAVGMSVSGTVPDATKEAINKILWG